ncbi:hypothetical protein VNI00_004699 [Paramarasmius palmivorus]|uniref:Uncharacterized protein n=1 Tax=Paramarasmius palmivorus TaxID=297713 RepID=A0AAW0DEV7_9AGAR
MPIASTPSPKPLLHHLSPSAFVTTPSLPFHIRQCPLRQRPLPSAEHQPFEESMPDLWMAVEDDEQPRSPASLSLFAADSMKHGPFKLNRRRTTSRLQTRCVVRTADVSKLDMLFEVLVSDLWMVIEDEQPDSTTHSTISTSPTALRH